MTCINNAMSALPTGKTVTHSGPVIGVNVLPLAADTETSTITVMLPTDK